jgi:GntR family transcriptional repressor for pyruvate dehydrogenase complex
MTNGLADTKKRYQQVVKAVQDAILAGRYEPGQRLPPERELAEEFKMSRPAIREAVIALEILGLVEARQGSGVYVLETAVSDTAARELDVGAFELTEARRLFEGEACALAASMITDAELDDLARIVERMIQENLGEAGEERADRAFHVAIARATRNPAMVFVVEKLWDLRSRSPLCAAMLARARLAGSKPLIDQHQVILDALRTRSPAAARAAMRDHLANVVEDLLITTEMDALQRAHNQSTERRHAMARRAAI